MSVQAIERSIIAASALVLLLVFLYPPFMCIDPESNGRVHASLGHHAVWQPPSQEYIFRTLYPSAPGLPNQERLAGFVPRVNRIRLTLYLLAVGLTDIVLLSALRRRRHREAPARI